MGHHVPPASLSFGPEVGRRLVDSDLEVVVTGGGGWLGRATLEMLDQALGDKLTSRVHVFGTSRRLMMLRSGASAEIRPLADLGGLRPGPHLLAHYAFATREHAEGLGVEQYIRRNQEITDLVIEHTHRSPPVGIFMPSSGAVYSGDELSVNPYGVLKARDEELFLALAQPGRAGPRVVVPRLFNLAGPFINKHERYALGAVLADIGRGGPIRLRADRPVVRSYVHVGDLVDLGFAAMLADDRLPKEAFDTAGERDIEIGELATLAASVLGHPNLLIERPVVDHRDPDRYVGDPTTMRRLAATYGVGMRALPRQIEDTARYLGLAIPA